MNYQDYSRIFIKKILETNLAERAFKSGINTNTHAEILEIMCFNAFLMNIEPARAVELTIQGFNEAERAEKAIFN